MTALSTTYRVRRWTYRDFKGIQKLERVFKVFGITLWVQVLDREEVPSWVVIQEACLGSTGWKSRIFKEHADKLDPR